MAHVAGHNTVSQSGVTRWDGGAASGKNMTERQGDTQDLYDRYGGGRFNPSYYTSPNWKPYVPPTSSGGGDFAAALAAIAAAQRGSGSSSTANNNAYNLGMAELAYKKKSDASADATALEALLYGRNKDARILGGMENFYNTGSYGKGFDKLLGMIDTQGKVSEKGVTDAYGRAVTNINEGYGAAQGLGDAGYAALNQYLGQNPNNPYAGMRASVGSAPDALTQYLSAYGVSDQPVQGQIQADQLQAQQGAGNYQNLIDILSGVAQSGASSRGAESAMGQNLFNTSLGQERAGYKGAANNAQAQALAALQQQMFQSRFGVENDRNSLANQLAQAIVAAGGTVSGATKTDPTKTDPTKTTTPGLAELLQQFDASVKPNVNPLQGFDTNTASAISQEDVDYLRKLQEQRAFLNSMNFQGMGFQGNERTIRRGN